jgi:hypothetical protein
MRRPVPPPESNRWRRRSVIPTVRVMRGVAVMVAVLLFASPVAASEASSSGRAVQTKSIHLPFGGCPSSQVTETVTMPGLTFSDAQPVTFRLTLRNSGSVACGNLSSGGPPQGPGPATLHSITLGPCGTVSMVVEGAGGKNVYPGSAMFACPLELSAQLPAHAALSTSGSWNQRGYGTAAGLVPRGHYRLIIGRRISFPIDLVT